MKRILAAILIAVISVMALTACAPDTSTVEDQDQPIEEAEITYEEDLSDYDSGAGNKTVNDTFIISKAEFYYPDTDEWHNLDFIPEGEKIILHDDGTCEYNFIYYETNEYMFSDVEPEWVTVEGYYEIDPEDGGISLTLKDLTLTGSIDENQLVIDYEDNLGRKRYTYDAER